MSVSRGSPVELSTFPCPSCEMNSIPSPVGYAPDRRGLMPIVSAHWSCQLMCGEVDQRQLVMRAVLPLHSFYSQDNVAFIMDINRELSGVALLVAGWVRKTLIKVYMY